MVSQLAVLETEKHSLHVRGSRVPGTDTHISHKNTTAAYSSSTREYHVLQSTSALKLTCIFNTWFLRI